jgi:hypothetical protein
MFEIDLFKKELIFYRQTSFILLPESLLLVADVLATERRADAPVAEGGFSVDERLVLPSLRPRFASPLFSDGGRFSSTRIE